MQLLQVFSDNTPTYFNYYKERPIHINKESKISMYE